MLGKLNKEQKERLELVLSKMENCVEKGEAFLTLWRITIISLQKMMINYQNLHQRITRSLTNILKESPMFMTEYQFLAVINNG